MAFFDIWEGEGDHRLIHSRMPLTWTQTWERCVCLMEIKLIVEIREQEVNIKQYSYALSSP